jgi:hypothetical protein
VCVCDWVSGLQFVISTMRVEFDTKQFRYVAMVYVVKFNSNVMCVEVVGCVLVWSMHSLLSIWRVSGAGFVPWPLTII